MDKNKLKNILTQVQNKEVDVEEAIEHFKALPYDDLGFAKIDTHRSIRKGFPEVIFCSGKTVNQVVAIVDRMAENSIIMGTRASEKMFNGIKHIRKEAVYHKTARIVSIGKPEIKNTKQKILVACAGTSDLPVAEEAAVTAELMGNTVEKLYDVGVAGIHRLFHNKDKLFRARVIIVAAGMDGALPSIIGGLVSCPVIAVPTSVGYGANFKGLAPLLTMLNSCSPGVTVVNIDNGFGAGYSASLINKES